MRAFLLLVIRLVADDLVCAVYLLEQHDTRKVMGKGNRAEAHALIATGGNGGRHAIASANDEGDMGRALHRKRFQLCGERGARGFLPADIEKNYMRVSREFIKARKDFALFALRRAIGNFLHVDAGVALKPLQVFGAGVFPESLFEFANGYDGSFLHASMVADSLAEWRSYRLTNPQARMRRGLCKPAGAHAAGITRMRLGIFQLGNSIQRRRFMASAGIRIHFRRCENSLFQLCQHIVND